MSNSNRPGPVEDESVSDIRSQSTPSGMAAAVPTMPYETTEHRRTEHPMTVARDIMTPDPQCVKEDETLVDAARLMRDLDVGALPICGNDERLKGMLTDRDI